MVHAAVSMLLETLPNTFSFMPKMAGCKVKTHSSWEHANILELQVDRVILYAKWCAAGWS